jgi:hypothetical protein
MAMGAQAVSEPRVLSHLRGRQAEIKTPRDQLNAVPAGRGGTVLVVGLAGTGNTDLLADFTDPDGNTWTIQEIAHHVASGAAR